MQRIIRLSLLLVLLAASPAAAHDGSDDTHEGAAVLRESTETTIEVATPAANVRAEAAQEVTIPAPPVREAPKSVVRPAAPPPERRAPVRISPAAPNPPVPNRGAVVRDSEEERRAAPAMSERARALLQEQHRAAQEQFVEARQQFVERLTEQRVTVQEQIREKRAALQERIERVGDERKRAVVLRIDRHIDAINAQVMKQFVGALDRLSHVLVRVNQRADVVATTGVSVTSVNGAIVNARGSIAAARAAVAEQAGRTYEIVITDEARLRYDVQQARQTLRADLGAVREQVRAAQDAVRRAVTLLGQIPAVDAVTIDASASGSANVSR